ncbi:MAG: restriction endonuclease subunit S [Spirochaetia bacterium]|nr:restriction endonuclease subunit S [Spirochaetia bacterium]
MNEWKTVRLGDVATYINGYAFKPSDWTNEGLPIIRIQNLTGNDYETNYFNGELPEKYYIKNGDVLISWSASLGVYEWKKSDALLNQHIFKVVFNKLDVDKKYFMFTVSNLLNAMTKQTHGSTMRHITKPDFDNMEFPLPPLAEQKHIAAILDKTQKIIAEHKQMLQKYDTLIKSRFIEMFGDPVTNTMAWEVRKLNELFEIIDGDRGKNYPKADELFDTEGYCLFLNAGNVTKTGFVFDNCQFITKEKDEILRKGKLKRKDIIVTTRGTVGNIAEYSDNITFKNMRINSGMVILRKIKEMNSTFFIYYFRNPAIYGRLISGTAQPQMPINNMKNCNVIVPPLTLQNDFAAFVQQIDKSKFAVQKSLKKTETLYKSLMQQYFA